jgi:hypothetical protein
VSLSLDARFSLQFLEIDLLSRAVQSDGLVSRSSSFALQVLNPHVGFPDMGRQRGGHPVPRQEAVDLVGGGLERFKERAIMLAGSVEQAPFWATDALAEVANNGRLPAGSTVEDVGELLEAITMDWRGAGASLRHRSRSKPFADPCVLHHVGPLGGVRVQHGGPLPDRGKLGRLYLRVPHLWLVPAC